MIGETNPGQVNGGAGFPLVVFQILTSQSVNDYFAQGFPGLELIILGQVADAGASAGQSLAGIGLQGSGQKLEEGGFACAVWPDQADALANRQVKRQIPEQWSLAESLCQSLHTEQHTHADNPKKVKSPSQALTGDY